MKEVLLQGKMFSKNELNFFRAKQMLLGGKTTPFILRSEQIDYWKTFEYFQNTSLKIIKPTKP